MKNKNLLAIIILAIQIGCMQAQSISTTRPTIVPVSPEAADVQKYNSYPVDYSTGIPNISIPLYEIKVGDIVLPITLSYHSAGLKPKEPSGRVGTGWSLHAEPSMMRSIRGVADDAIYGLCHVPNSPTIDMDKIKEYNRKVADGEYDGESDIYSYSLNPGGGTCYWSKKRGVLVAYPRTNDVIDCWRNNNTVTVTTGDGLVYTMGARSSSQERTDDYITRWLCDDITSIKTNATINFNYQTGNPLYPNSYINLSDALSIEYLPNQYYLLITETGVNFTTCYKVYSTGQKEWVSTTSSPGTLFVKRMNRVKLSTISFNGHTVRFTYKTLNGIDTATNMIVTDAQGNQIRTVEFFVTPCNDRTVLTKLDSVRISVPNCDTRTYKFAYYNPEGVPSCDTQDLDHWGFYNGQRYGNNGGRPTIYAPLSFNKPYLGKRDTIIKGNDREPNAEYTKYGILNQIYHPEGVITSFEYAGNAGGFMMYYVGSDSSGKYDSYAHPVGGLRVSRIVESVAAGRASRTTSEKRYQYGIKSSSDTAAPSVIGGGVIKHIVTQRDYCFRYETNGNGSGNVRTWGAMPLSNITFNNGSAVLYSYVKEDIMDMDAGNTLTNKYYYDVPRHRYNNTFLWDDHYNPTKIKTGFYDLEALQESSPYERIVRKRVDRPYDTYESERNQNKDNDQMFGHLERVEHYKNGDTLVASEHYKYYMTTFDLVGNVEVYKPYRKNVYIGHGQPNEADDKQKYDEFNTVFGESFWTVDAYRWKYLLQETNRQYFYQNGSRQTVEVVKDYDYGWSHTHPVTIETTNNTQTITNKYAYHNKMVNTLVSHKRIVNGGDTTTITAVDYSANNRPEKVRYKTGKMNTLYDEIIYHKYDSYGNVAEVSAIDEKHTCYIWSYNNQHPVAEIDNATYPEVLQALGKTETWINELGNKYKPADSDITLLNGLRNKMKNAHISTFSFQPLLGVASITNPSGFTTYYEHDKLGRLTQSSIMENGTKKVMQEHQYHVTQSSVSPGKSVILGINIAEGSVVEAGKEILVEVDIAGGGPEDVVISRWELYNCQTNSVYQSLGSHNLTTHKFTIKPVYPTTAVKTNCLWIEILDRRSITNEEFKTFFYVKPAS